MVVKNFEVVPEVFTYVPMNESVMYQNT